MIVIDKSGNILKVGDKITYYSEYYRKQRYGRIVEFKKSNFSDAVMCYTYWSNHKSLKDPYDKVSWHFNYNVLKMEPPKDRMHCRLGFKACSQKWNEIK